MRTLSHLEAEHQKLTMDPRCTPQRVFSAHSLNQIAQFPVDFWLPGFSSISSAKGL
jgi:hypothetical protein